MRDKMRKKYQSGLRHLIKDLNKNIENDTLWNGRYVFHIVLTHFERFEDGSGGLLYAVVRGYDKADGYFSDYMVEYAPYLYGCNFDIWKMANHFIVNGSNTYKDGRNPFEQKKDYTKVKVDDEVWNLPLTL